MLILVFLLNGKIEGLRLGFGDPEALFEVMIVLEHIFYSYLIHKYKGEWEGECRMMMFWSEIIDGEVVVLKVLFVGFHLVCQQSLQLFHLGQQVDQLCLPLPFLLHLQVLLLHLLRYLP